MTYRSGPENPDQYSLFSRPVDKQPVDSGEATTPQSTHDQGRPPSTDSSTESDHRDTPYGEHGGNTHDMDVAEARALYAQGLGGQRAARIVQRVSAQEGYAGQVPDSIELLEDPMPLEEGESPSSQAQRIARAIGANGLRKAGETDSTIAALQRARRERPEY